MKLCNYLQNVGAITCISILQQPTFLICNFLHFYSTINNETFFYITAGGDERASGGQDEVKAMLDANDVKYTYGTWNAQNSEDEQNAAVEELLSENLPINMIRFETGTVFKEGQSGMEHMASFNYAYKISAVRDWLFEQ